VSDPAATGQFWICPSCRKHVPVRSAACRCGCAKNDSAPVVDGGIDAAAAHVRPRHRVSPLRLATVGSVAAVMAGAVFFSLHGLWRDSPPAPRVIYVPVPVPAGSTQPEDHPKGAALSSPDAPGATTARTPAAAPVASPSAPSLPSAKPARVKAAEVAQLENTADHMRAAGATAFEQSMRVLSAKADQADGAWRQYLKSCRMSTPSVTVAGIAEHDWLAVDGAGVPASQLTNACGETGRFFVLARQVRDGMCLAEEKARQALVYPGTIRALRRKYRLDSDGWDRACR